MYDSYLTAFRKTGWKLADGCGTHEEPVCQQDYDTGTWQPLCQLLGIIVFYSTQHSTPSDLPQSHNLSIITLMIQKGLCVRKDKM